MKQEFTNRLEPIHVWGLPLLPVTQQSAVDEVERLIQAGKPTYVVTANLNYAMLNDTDVRIQQITKNAGFLIADGMPLVWASKFRKRSLPCRLTGADLMFGLLERSALKGYRIYFFGGHEGQAEEATRILQERYPKIQIVGSECPPFRSWTEEEKQQRIERIRAAKPDLLFVCLGQPKGDFWIQENLQALEVPVSIQVGGSLDFITGRVRRAPKWMQKTGMEWFYRFYQEPRRLGGRYFRNFLFIGKMLIPTFRRKPNVEQG